MTETRVAAVAANFGRDLEDTFDRIAVLLDDARARGTHLVVLPEATLGGYLANLDGAGDASLPPALDLDGPEVKRLAALAGDLVVTAGLCEADGDRRYNTAVAVGGDGVLGVHRKVHQPLGEGASYAAGEDFLTFDSPVGRLGMMICYDKAFPEAARALAMDGAQVICCMSAWPTARTLASPDIADDRWARRFDLFDRARALENQVVWVSANQSGTFGDLRFVASAKVVDAGGDVLASTGYRAGVAYAAVDLDEMLGSARRHMFHLRDRRPDAYVSSGVRA
ncbi:carbon-nitrogen hydrolase family protein [uncultured Jatrophihabitans sp.]|uniref:carbon-nitrogen hydrolase family protein n=1 Tax=uncultured Jatrophihabitans sp. TaxID=1610747 RepID=UPI0035CC0D24